MTHSPIVLLMRADDAHFQVSQIAIAARHHLSSLRVNERYRPKYLDSMDSLAARAPV